jgi:general secretion pathway protein D
MLAGLIRDDERRVLDGIPGLSDLPIIGRLFAHSKKETQETDIVLTLTPRIIRVLDLSENDLRPFRVGRETGLTTIDLPSPMPLAPVTPASSQPGAFTPQPAAPLLPPSVPAQPQAR